MAIRAANTVYLQNGITITPKNPSVGDKVKISYDGLLAKSGATDVFAHVGYGVNFDQADDIRMQKNTTGFETTMSVIKDGTMSLCFRDSANNWDNNSGRNYVFDVD